MTSPQGGKELNFDRTKTANLLTGNELAERGISPKSNKEGEEAQAKDEQRKLDV